MDNASYHSRQSKKIPNSSTKKADILNFLLKEKITIPDLTATKPVLLDLVKSVASTVEYAVDSLIQEAGHEILRLPPYHCKFNPIEMVWGEMKAFVRRNNVDPTNDENVISLLRQAADLVTPQKWQNYVRHVIAEENKFYNFDKKVDENEDEGRLIISIPVCANSDESSSDEEDY